MRKKFLTRAILVAGMIFYGISCTQFLAFAENYTEKVTTEDNKNFKLDKEIHKAQFIGVEESGAALTVPGQIIIEDVNYEVNSINVDLNSNLESIQQFTIPASITSINFNNASLAKLEKFLVNADNPSYLSESGVLFDKSKTTLIKFPNGKPCDSDYIIPEGVTTVAINAFKGGKHEFGIKFPSTFDHFNSNESNNAAFLDAKFTQLDFSAVKPELFQGDSEKNNVKNCEITTIIYPNDSTTINICKLFNSINNLKVIKLPITLTSFFKKNFILDTFYRIDESKTLKKILDLDGQNFKNNYFEFDGTTFFDIVNSRLLYFLPGCDNLTYEIPCIKSIVPGAFNFVKSLNEITIKEGLQCIPTSLMYCHSLKKLILPKSLKVVDYAGIFVSPHFKLTIKNPDTIFGPCAIQILDEGGEGLNIENFDIEIPCNFDKSNFSKLGTFIVDPDNDNNFKLMGVEGSKPFTYTPHDLYYDTSKKKTICRLCGQKILAPEHKCEYVKATCTYPEHCNICGKLKKTKFDTCLNPDNHDWKLDPDTRKFKCKVCGEEVSVASQEQVISTETTSDYECEGISPFNDESICNDDEQTDTETDHVCSEFDDGYSEYGPHCTICGKLKNYSETEHTCEEYVDANCKYPAHCKTCGRYKLLFDEDLDPDNHEWELDSETGEVKCNRCQKLAASTTKKVILTRTTPILSYHTDTNLSNFTGDKIESPKLTNPEKLELNNFEGDKFTFKLTLAKNQNIQDYKVTANNSVLEGNLEAGTRNYSYEVNITEPLTFINIEPVCDPTNDGVVTPAKEYIAAFKCLWRNN